MRHLLVLSLNNDPTSQLGTAHAGGQTKYVLELSKNLLFRGCTVEILTLGNADQVSTEEVFPGACVTRFVRPSEKPYGYDLTLDEIAQISDVVSDYAIDHAKPFDAVLCCYWVSGEAALKIAKRCQCPLIVSFCSLAALKQSVENNQHICQRFRAEKHLGLHCDRIIATTDAEKQTLISKYGLDPEKVSVIPRGIDLSVFYP